jgi:hypothetical protein
MLSAMAVLAMLSTVSAEQSRLRMNVWPTIAQAPAVVRIEVLLEPDDKNRSLEIVVESGEYYRSSTIELDGAGAARFHSVQYRAMPAGTYDVRVLVRGAGGATLAAEHRWVDVTS